MGSRLDKNSAAVSKRIQGHEFDNEEGEEYGGSKFGGFTEYFRRKKIKLQNLDAQVRAESEDNPKIFRGIVAQVNGYTQPSLNDLHRLIVTHGGGFMQYLDGKTTVTHIIASNLTPKKVVEFKRYRIVKPAWIVDSVKAAKLLPWEGYRVVDEGLGQKVLQFDDGKLGTQINRKSTGYRDQSDTSWYANQLANDASAGKGNGSGSFNDLDDLDFPSSAQLIDERDHGSDPRSLQPTKDYEDAEPPASNGILGLKQNEVFEVPEAAIEIRMPSELHHDTEEQEEQEQPGTVSMKDSAEQPHIADDVTLDDDRDPTPPSYPLPNSPASKRKSDAGDSPLPAKRAKMTAEEHNSVLLADPRIRKSSVLNPDFLEQYYRESRLHHLSAWKADLKAQLQAATAEKTSTQKARQKRPANARRYILHVDFDSFFVAVSLKNFPQYVDKPAVVAHGAGSGSEIASCNYPARKFGIKNGMWMKRAQEMCEDIKVLPYDFPAYEAASRLFYEAIINTGGLVQSVSIDEALVDVSVECHKAGGTEGATVREGSLWREQAKADEIAQGLRDQVKEQTGCAVSVGIGGNILLAKLALRKAKPAGQYHIKPEDALDFIAGLEVQSLPGVAYSIGGKLEEIGIKFVKDIREVTRERLTSVLGPKTGEKIWNYSRAIDRTEVGDQVVRKSVSAEVNWGVRFETQDQADEFIENLCGELSKRLLKEGVRGTNLTMKIMRRAPDAPLDPPKHLGHGKCDTYNKSIALGIATNIKDVLAKEALSIMRSYGFSPGELRGLGVQVTKLEPIKPGTSTVAGLEGSQRRLQFKSGPVVRPLGDAITAAPNDPPAPQSSQRHLQFRAPNDASSKPSAPPPDEIQDDPVTPRKPKPSLAPGQPARIDSPSRRPLNISGTQFVLPTQVDPRVLAELPQDIRDRLAKHISARPPPQQNHAPDSTHDRPPMAFTALPSSSQLDPSMLDALPADVRAEILSQYNKSPSKPGPSRGQSLLPQSPRKDRTLRGAPMRGGPRKRGRPRGGSLLSRLKGPASRGASTLTQSNFIATTSVHRAGDGATDSESDLNRGGEIAPDFLAALPDDVRAEVLENHKREQLKRTAGIEISRRRRQQQQQRLREQDAHERVGGERVLRLPARATRPTFTPQKLWRMQELREAVSAWVEEFADAGPYDEDVEALGRYLKAVVVDEGNMRKAVDVVRWVRWCVEQHVGDDKKGKADMNWEQALDMARKAVTEAVGQRGLGGVEFEM